MIVIFKPTLRCNIKCQHCYVGEQRSAYNDMTLDNALLALSKVEESSEVVLHGGEPMLLGAGYYRELIRAFPKLTFSMQTNLTLLDTSWLSLLSGEIGNRLSTSFDCFSSIRPVDIFGWLLNIKFLRRNGIRPYVVSMLTMENQDRGRSIYHFFSSLDLPFRLNALNNLGFARGSLDSMRHTPLGYAGAIKEVFDEWFMNPEARIVVDPCAEILSFFGSTGIPVGTGRVFHRRTV